MSTWSHCSDLHTQVCFTLATTVAASGAILRRGLMLGGGGNMRLRGWTLAIAIAWTLVIAAAWSSEAQERGVASVEFVTGHAGYVDEAWDHRVMTGGVVRFAVTPRFTVGPEVVYLHGSNGSHEVTVTGTVTYDLFRSAGKRPVAP